VDWDQNWFVTAIGLGIILADISLLCHRRLFGLLGSQDAPLQMGLWEDPQATSWIFGTNWAISSLCTLGWDNHIGYPRIYWSNISTRPHNNLLVMVHFAPARSHWDS